MKKFFLPILMVLTLGANSSAFAQQDRYDRYHDRRYDNRNQRVIVVPNQRPYYQSPNYDYRRYNGYYNRSYIPTRYNSPQYYYGSRYIQHNGRYYDQCSNNDRQAAAAVGVVLGGLVGNQISDSTGGTVAGAIIGGMIANEVARDQDRHRSRAYCWR